MTNKFGHRSYESEILDSPEIPRDLLYKNLQELNWINSSMGGHSISMKGIKELMDDQTKTWHIADLGCGGGDILRHIAEWARRNKFKVKLTGVDRNSDAIFYLSNQCRNYPEIVGVVSDVKDFLDMEESVDIVHCSLFCHHLNEKELLDFFYSVKQNVSTGFVINDLHRCRFAYAGVWLLTRLLNSSSLSKHDGPISVLRGFKKKELEKLLDRIKFKQYIVQWKWAFRYLIVGKI